MAIVGCAILVLALAACDTTERKTEDPPVSPTQPVGSPCERVLPTMRGSWKAERGETARGGQPLSDTCWLTDAADAKHRIRISVSVLPMTAEDLAKVRDTDSFYMPVVDGEVGKGSWATSSTDDARVMISSSERLVRVVTTVGWTEGLAEARAVAKTVDGLPGGVPAAQAVIRRPECDRGTAAAEKLLGMPARARRDSVSDGRVRCLWGTTRGTAFAEAGGIRSAPGEEFSWIKTLDPIQAKQVKIGAEGRQTAEVVTYRVGKDTYVSVGAGPFLTTDPAAVRALALAMLPVYGG
jgi:hypothetical protein